MVFPKWAICYIYYRKSDGLVIFLDYLTLDYEGARSLKNVGTTNPVTLHHIPEDLNTQV